MFVVEQFAALLARKVDGVQYGDHGNIFLNKLPDTYGRDAICLMEYSTESGFPSAHDEHSIQVKVRGSDLDDSLSGYQLARDIWFAVHGWEREVSPDPDNLIDFIVAAGPPQSIGYDEQDRPEWTVNFMVIVRQDTEYRSLA